MLPEFRIVAHHSPEYDEGLVLRRGVLREPLGLVYTLDQVDAEREELHMVAVFDGEVVACASLADLGRRVAKMRQVAVKLELQGSGIGAALVRFFEDTARARGFARIALHARQSAVPFYEHLGYHTFGPIFEEVGLPHLRMEKNLS